MRTRIEEHRVSKRGDRYYSDVTRRTYATRAAALRAERNAK